MNLSGWKMRDKAGHLVFLDGVVAPGGDLKIHLAAGQMPLNNNGDAIELLNAESQVADKVSYSSGQVSPGREIQFGP